MSVQEIRIKSDGKWYADDNEMFRIQIVNLFATHLQRNEAGEYYIELQDDSYPILVDDVPFTAVAAEVVEGAIVFRFHDEQQLRVEESTPLTMKGDVPYLSMRWPDDTRLNRSAYWMISNMLEEIDGQVFVVPPGNNRIPTN